LAAKKAYLLDMDGVIIRGKTPIPGAQDFIERLIATDTRFAILTNNPMFTPRDLQHRLAITGLQVPIDRLFTSAMATAQFLKTQQPNGSAFVIGESGLTTALYDVGYVLTDNNPDYVVIGETTSYSYAAISSAVNLIYDGARFIATNPDNNGPSERGIEPACGAMAALVEKATGVAPYFIGKPNPLMMRMALRFLGAHSEETIMVGDRMDTDIISGVESGLDTVLVLTGLTSRDQVKRFPYCPTRILDSVADIEIV